MAAAAFVYIVWLTADEGGWLAQDQESYWVILVLLAGKICWLDSLACLWCIWRCYLILIGKIWTGGGKPPLVQKIYTTQNWNLCKRRFNLSQFNRMKGSVEPVFPSWSLLRSIIYFLINFQSSMFLFWLHERLLRNTTIFCASVARLVHIIAVYLHLMSMKRGNKQDMDSLEDFILLLARTNDNEAWAQLARFSNGGLSH